MFDEKSFEELFRVYYRPLCYYARKFALDHVESEEVVEQVFLKLWEIREVISIEKSASAYLYRSVRNQSINYLKQRITFSKNKEDYALKLRQSRLFSAISEEDGASALLARELEQQINQAINDLPEKCREIFLLSRSGNLSIKEIAEKLHISTNTVQKQISIAIAKLREILSYYLTGLLAVLHYFF
ncbi:MAG: RNA polymerase sigma-70 factor [Prolixibacteraceae bacterium]